MTFKTETRQCVQNRRVQFQIKDVYFPEGKVILDELHGKDVLRGRVIDQSAGAQHGEIFLVVEVEGLTQPVVVPLRCVQESL